MHHIFDISIAEKYNVNVAIFLNNLAFWIQKNVANKTNFHQGKFWTYNSQKAYAEIFPYWNRQTIRTIINFCLKNKLIITGNFNENKYLRTTWYAFTEKGIELFSSLKNAIESIGENQPMGGLDSTTPLVDSNQCTNTDNKPDVKKDREGNTKKRFSLSDLNMGLINEEILKDAKNERINLKNCFDKFINYLNSKSRKSATIEDLQGWFLKEIGYIQRNKIKKEENQYKKDRYDEENERRQKENEEYDKKVTREGTRIGLKAVKDILSKKR